MRAWLRAMLLAVPPWPDSLPPTLHTHSPAAVGTYLRQAGFNWSARPSLLPVPQAANCIVAWHPGKSSRKSAAELKLVASWQQRLGTGEC